MQTDHTRRSYLALGSSADASVRLIIILKSSIKKMEAILNRNRLFLGMCEFFIFGSITFISLNLLQRFGIDANSFGGIWIFLIGYALILPLFFNGRTLFMLALRLELKKNDELISINDFILRSMLKLPYVLFGGSIIMMLFKKGKPFYDTKLEIELFQNNI